MCIEASTKCSAEPRPNLQDSSERRHAEVSPTCRVSRRSMAPQWRSRPWTLRGRRTARMRPGFPRQAQRNWHMHRFSRLCGCPRAWRAPPSMQSPTGLSGSICKCASAAPPPPLEPTPPCHPLSWQSCSSRSSQRTTVAKQTRVLHRMQAMGQPRLAFLVCGSGQLRWSNARASRRGRRCVGPRTRLRGVEAAIS